MIRCLPLLSTLLLLAASISAAPPIVPPGIPYQGVLLDSGGQPQTGAVDLTIRIYDQILGGSLVYKEVFQATPLVDGVFAIELGPTGAAADTPADPLTTSLTDALTADVGATGSGRYIEVQVGSATPQNRNPVLTVPYALRSSSADVAGVAVTALDAQSIGGVDPVAVQAMFENWNADGGPPSTDPSEGLADVDNDGIPNFADNDNDNDGISDTSEVSQGSNINLVTPTISSVTPDVASVSVPTPITVAGTNFDPGLTAVLGAEVLAPANILPDSFDATVAPVAGGPADLTVTLANGESATRTAAVTFTPPPPPTPVPLPVPLLSTTPVQLAFDATDRGLLSIHPSYFRDETDDGSVDFVGSGVTPNGYTLRVATLDAGGRIVALNCANSTCPLALWVDADGDGVVGDVTIPIETIGGPAPHIRAPSLTYDNAGHALVGYVKRTLNGAVSDAMLAHDRDGSGSFEAAEVVTLEAVGDTGDTLGRVAFDSANRAVYTWVDTTTFEIRLAFDVNGDGDFDDVVGGTLEKQTVDTLASPVSCLGAAFDENDLLAVVYSTNSPGVDPIRVAWDSNGDGDFADAGETQQIAGTATAPGCDVQAQAGGGIAVAHSGNELRLVADQNGDRDFDDPGEDALLANIGFSTTPLVMDRLSTGQTVVVVPDGFVIDPALP